MRRIQERDVIGRDDRPSRAPSSLLRRPAVALVGGTALLTAACGVAVLQAETRGRGQGAHPAVAAAQPRYEPAPGLPLPPTSPPLGTPAPPPVIALPAPVLEVSQVGGAAHRTRRGATGQVRLHVQHSGPRARLVSLWAEVPGVWSTDLVPPGGLDLQESLGADLVLGFVVTDCDLLRRAGRVVVQTESGGVLREHGLPITHDREAGTLRGASLDQVLQACPS